MMSGSKVLGFVLFGMFLSKMMDVFSSGNKELSDNGSGHNSSGHSNCGKKDDGWSSSTLSDTSKTESTSSNYGIGHGPYNTSWQPSYGWM